MPVQREKECRNKDCIQRNSYKISRNIYEKAMAWYPGDETIITESGNGFYIYGKTQEGKINSEISFLQIDAETVLIIMKKPMKEKALTDGGLRVLNHLNCGKHLLTHQVDINSRVYKCRCIVSSKRLEEEFTDIMQYLEAESKKAERLLAMECK